MDCAEGEDEMSKRARGGEEMSEEPTASCGHAFDVWYGFGVCPECHNELLARVKVLEEALEYAALCPVCADIEECKCQPDCEDCVKTMQKARAALRAERGGEDE